MPSSQLSQLKNALSSSGLGRKSHSKKEKKAFKKGGGREADKAKTLARLEEIRRGLNKFDVRETKTKHDVGGRKLKGVVGRPSAAKSAGLAQRQKSLLPEHELRNHTGTFADRRFGESNPSMSLEDRMLERYTREQQRGQGRKGMFNLEDDDPFGAFGGGDDAEEGTALGGLTHGGRSVMDLKGDDFAAQGLGDSDDDDDDEENPIRAQRRLLSQRRDEHGGEEEDLPERKKSKQEVMNEIIAKSKDHKYQRQMQAEADANLRDELDEDLDELRALLAGTAQPGPSTAKKAVTHGGGVNGIAPAEGDSEERDYDAAVRTMALEQRAKPKDRTKTEVEQAIEEKERLEKAEAKRQRRMRGEPSDSEGDGEDDEAGVDGNGRRGKKRKVDAASSRREADDLDDDFDEPLLGPGLTREDFEAAGRGVALENGSDDDDDDDDEEEVDDEDDDEDDEHEGGDEGEDDEDDEGEDEDEDDAAGVFDMEESGSEAGEEEGNGAETTQLVGSSRKSTDSKKGKSKEIPYTFPCPESIDELEELLENIDDESIPTVVQRIRALHHPSLAEGNKQKLQNLLGILIDYVLILSSRPESATQVIAGLYPHMIALVKLNVLSAHSHFVHKLRLMQKNMMQGLKRGSANPDSKTLPGQPELVLLRLIGKIWSTSDLHHPVAMPAMLLMGQYLGQSRIRRVSDLASGLVLCSIVAQYEEQSKRFMPEAVNFLATTVRALLKRRKDAVPVIAYPDMLAPGVELFISADSTAEANESADLAVALRLDNNSIDEAVEQVKADLLAVAFRLVQTFATLYNGLDAFIEIFTPLRSVLAGSRVAKLGPELKALHASTLSTLTRLLSFAGQARKPLTLQAHKPIPIPSLAPKFESDFAPGRRYDPDVERNAAQKLKAMYKKEHKGAMRELRKDNRFLASVKAQENKAKDEGYIKRMRQVEGSIQSERAEEKEMQREKEREKRRRG